MKATYPIPTWKLRSKFLRMHRDSRGTSTITERALPGIFEKAWLFGKGQLSWCTYKNLLRRFVAPCCHSQSSSTEYATAGKVSATPIFSTPSLPPTCKDHLLYKHLVAVLCSGAGWRFYFKHGYDGGYWNWLSSPLLPLFVVKNMTTYKHGFMMHSQPYNPRH